MMISFRMTLPLLALSLIAGCGAAPSGSAVDTQDPLLVGNWSGSSMFLQPGAVTTAQGSLNLPVCRAPYDGGWHPGKFWQGQCLFEWGGQGLAAGPASNGRGAVVSTFQT